MWSLLTHNIYASVTAVFFFSLSFWTVDRCFSASLSKRISVLFKTEKYIRNMHAFLALSMRLLRAALSVLFASESMHGIHTLYLACWERSDVVLCCVCTSQIPVSPRGRHPADRRRAQPRGRVRRRGRGACDALSFSPGDREEYQPRWVFFFGSPLTYFQCQHEWVAVISWESLLVGILVQSIDGWRQFAHDLKFRWMLEDSGCPFVWRTGVGRCGGGQGLALALSE